MKRIHILIATLVIVVILMVFKSYISSIPMVAKMIGRSTIESRVMQFHEQVYVRLSPYFNKANIAYPPSEIILVGLKQERRLELYAGASTNTMKFIRSYPIQAASGSLGPKLKEGDHQVPEGIYQIESLNPNSSYHLSMLVNYPNVFDQIQAKKDGRTNLGGDIFIHGKAVSIGCLAMGNEVIEELFVLAAESKDKNIDVILSPVDFRKTHLQGVDSSLNWKANLYHKISMVLRKLP